MISHSSWQVEEMHSTEIDSKSIGPLHASNI
jgi:hypothetical protein